MRILLDYSGDDMDTFGSEGIFPFKLTYKLILETVNDS